jgi:hypothetical protein
MMSCGELDFDPGRLNGVNNLLTVSGDDYAIDITGRPRALRDPANHGFSGDFD